MAAGKPVIVLRGGGVEESVVSGKTGVFFNEARVGSLIEAIKSFDRLRIKSEDCRCQAEKFSKERFKKEIKGFVEAKYRTRKKNFK